MKDRHIINDLIVKDLDKYEDARGWLLELFRKDDVDEKYLPVMGYISMTKPGVTRGPHEHISQSDLFCFTGPSTFQVYLWDNRLDSETFGNHDFFLAGEKNPLMIIVPPGVVHAYKNIGNTNGLVINCPNRLYKGEGKNEPVDEIRHEDTDSKFKVR